MTSSQPLNTLQLIPALHEGGTEQGTFDMAIYTQQQGATAYVASAGGVWAERLQAAGIHHTKLNLTSKMPWIVLWNACRIYRLIWQHRIHIVHARSRAPAWSAWLACQLPHFRCVHFITTFHGTYGAKSALKRWYNRVMLRGKLTIANSRFIARHIHTAYAYPTARLVVAERGVDPDVFNPDLYGAAEQQALRDELALSATTPLVLMVGRLTRWKGQVVLLQALAQLTDLPWVVAFAGDAKNSAYLDELKTLAQTLQIGDRVRWLGPRRDVPLLNAVAAVACSCSTEPEAFGRVAIEAMAMGTPIIASAHGGSLETVVDGTTGLLVPPSNVAALAKALRQLLTQPNSTMGQAGRAHVLAHFTKEHTCAAEWSAYQRLLTVNLR